MVLDNDLVCLRSFRNRHHWTVVVTAAADQLHHFPSLQIDCSDLAKRIEGNVEAKVGTSFFDLVLLMAMR